MGLANKKKKTESTKEKKITNNNDTIIAESKVDDTIIEPKTKPESKVEPVINNVDLKIKKLSISEYGLFQRTGILPK